MLNKEQSLEYFIRQALTTEFVLRFNRLPSIKIFGMMNTTQVHEKKTSHKKPIGRAKTHKKGIQKFKNHQKHTTGAILSIFTQERA